MSIFLKKISQVFFFFFEKRKGRFAPMKNHSESLSQLLRGVLTAFDHLGLLLIGSVIVTNGFPEKYICHRMFLVHYIASCFPNRTPLHCCIPYVAS